MDLGWKFLIPLALGWFIVVAAVKVTLAEDAPLGPVLAASAAGLALGGLLLRLAVRTGQTHRGDESVAVTSSSAPRGEGRSR
jgi:NADH-quinone oxidoreductase subunit H